MSKYQLKDFFYRIKNFVFANQLITTSQITIFIKGFTILPLTILIKYSSGVLLIANILYSRKQEEASTRWCKQNDKQAWLLENDKTGCYTFKGMHQETIIRNCLLKFF